MGSSSSRETTNKPGRAGLYDSSSVIKIHTQFAPEDMPIDPLHPPAILPKAGYQVELGSDSFQEMDMTLEDCDLYSLYFKTNFSGSPHINFVGGNAADPVVVSVQFGKLFDQYKVLIRTRKFDHHYTIAAVSNNAKVLAALYNLMPPLRPLRLKFVKDPHISQDLLHLEDRLLIKNYKFGVIYCKEGQTNEEEMFSNEQGSAQFEEFLNLLGQKVPLKGWKGFDGELDILTDTTGTHSVVTQVEGFDIMFHVSTLLPLSRVNKQQIERKRHIGNDIVCFVFQDSSTTPFNPVTIKSKYNHVYIVVQAMPPSQSRSRGSSTASNSDKKEKRSHSTERQPKQRYRVAVVSKKGVRSFGPMLPDKKLFKHDAALRQFLLAKAINGERAAYAAPGFGVQRTRKEWLKGVVEKYS